MRLTVRDSGRAGGELSCGAVQLLIDFGMRLNVAEHGESGRDGERVAGERACLINGTAGGDVSHDVAAPAIGRDGQAAADDFAEGGEVGQYVVQLLSAAGRHAEASHDLIEDKQRTVLAGDAAQGFEIAGLGRNAAHIAADGLDNDRRDLFPERSKVSSTASLLLSGRAMVVSLKPLGTPGESGRPRVATPEPALTSSESTWP